MSCKRYPSFDELKIINFIGGSLKVIVCSRQLKNDIEEV